jgi:uncharacterized membrane protein YeaQ/YmgE (transglycosylase-associated protein family)
MEAMTVVEFLLFLLIAGICGAIAQSLVGYSHGGCLVSIALGLIGALVGAYLARLFGVGDILSIDIGGRPFPVVWSIIGAAIFVALLRLISRPPTA